jgi:hypothetical protein
VGDEVEKLELILEVSVSGLTYSEKDLVALLDELVEKSIPDEYVISEKDREIKVEFLGNTDSSVLSTTEADLQVTAKTFVVPNISMEEIKDKLKGKSTPEAEKVLGGLRGIESYEINIDGGLPLFNKIPTDAEKISLEIVKADE